jgi:hypothetical protein
MRNMTEKQKIKLEMLKLERDSDLKWWQTLGIILLVIGGVILAGWFLYNKL